MFGHEAANLSALISQQGLNLLTDGYSWWSSTSWNLYLYRTKFTNGDGKELNMHNQRSDKVMEQLSAAKTFDVQSQYSQEKPYVAFHNETCFIVRHATGDDLCGRTADIYQ